MKAEDRNAVVDDVQNQVGVQNIQGDQKLVRVQKVVGVQKVHGAEEKVEVHPDHLARHTDQMSSPRTQGTHCHQHPEEDGHASFVSVASKLVEDLEDDGEFAATLSGVPCGRYIQVPVAVTDLGGTIIS